MNINNNYQYNIPNFTGNISVSRIKKLIEEGKSIQEISQITGYSKQNMYKTLKNLDIKTPRQRQLDKRNSTETIKIIIDNIAQGKSIKEISQITNIKKSLIYRLLKLNNIQTPNKNKNEFASQILPKLMYNKTKNQIQEETGLNVKYIDKWVYQNFKMTLSEVKKNFRSKLAHTRMTDAEIATQTGLSVDGVKSFRYRTGISANQVHRELIDKEILDGIKLGQSKKEIAKRLNISVNTINRHLSKMHNIDVEI